jgi:enoyl-CoA hydratase
MPLPVLGMELARDRLSPSHLTAATLFAEIVDPERSLAFGWTDELAAEEELMDAAVANARRLAALPRDAYAKTKTALRERTVRYIRETLAADLARLTPPG